MLNKNYGRCECGGDLDINVVDMIQPVYGVVIAHEHVNTTKPLADIERFEKLFNEIGIEYERELTSGIDWNENALLNTDSLIISDSNVFQCWGNTVQINFDLNGKFKEFEGFGD